MKELFKNLKFAWKFAKYQKLKIIKFILLNILRIIISVIIPILSAKIIISLTNNNFEQIILIAIVIFIVENIRNIMHYLTRYYTQIIYRETFTKIEIELGKNILKFL